MSEHVQAMFSSIAHRYDRANTILSLGVHHRWRAVAVRLSGATLGSRVLDVATGTGDLAIAFKKVVGQTGVVTGTDLNAEMLSFAPQKAQKKHFDITFLQADAETLPFPDATFDVCSIAFGIRNVDNPSRAIAEMRRVTVPGGRVVVLEFGQPRGILGIFYRWYSKHVIPLIGKLVTGTRAPYEYLPDSASRFPSGFAFVDLMRKAGGFASVQQHALTGGVAYIYIGEVA